MSNVKKMTAAERAGHTVGQWLKPVVRLETAVLRSLVAAGVPHALVVAFKWGGRLALALGLLYFAFVPALIVLSLAWFLLHGSGTVTADDEEYRRFAEFQDLMDEEDARKPELRDGHSGWGWYSHDDHALDIEHPDDTSQQCQTSSCRPYPSQRF